MDIFSADSRLFMVTKTKIFTSDMKGLKTRILFDSQNFRNGSEISHIYNSAANIFARINNTDLLIYNYADSTFRLLKSDLQNFTLTRTFLDFSENIFLGTQSSGLTGWQ